MSEKKLLVFSIVLFIVVAIIALAIVLSKGTIFGMRLVSLETSADSVETFNADVKLNILVMLMVKK